MAVCALLFFWWHPLERAEPVNSMRTLEIKPSGDTDIVAIRKLPASRERVFQALTTPALLQQWHLGPEGWQLPVCNVNLQVGKPYRFVWRREGEPDLGSGGQIAFAMLPIASNTTALTLNAHMIACAMQVYTKRVTHPASWCTLRHLMATQGKAW
eukprot:14355-Heterococcus_DN1.PRE.3